MAKLRIGDLRALDFSIVVSSLSSSISFVGSSTPFDSGLSGSKNPVGFLKEAINSRFSIASSAIKRPGVNPDLGSSDKLTAIIFILSISTP